MLKSFYTIEMYIQPGCGRYALVFVANSLLEIQEALRLQLSNKFNLHLLLDYGEDIRLCTYQHGNLISDLNLLPYISVDIAGYGTFTIDEHQQVTPAIDEEFGDLLFQEAETLAVAIFVDWSKLEIPALIAPLLMPGEETSCIDHYTAPESTPELLQALATAQGDPDNYGWGVQQIEYGWNDLEGGEEIINGDEYFAINEEAIARVVFR